MRNPQTSTTLQRVLQALAGELHSKVVIYGHMNMVVLVEARN